MAQKRRGKMTRKQRQRQLHRRMFLTGVLVVLICVGIYSGIRIPTELFAKARIDLK